MIPYDTESSKAEVLKQLWNKIYNTKLTSKHKFSINIFIYSVFGNKLQLKLTPFHFTVASVAL